MASSIDKHLMCPRAISRRGHDDYHPPFPMWAGRTNEQLTHVLMAYLGVPLHGDAQRERALQAMRSFNPPDGPRAHNKTHHTDSSRCDNLRLVGYRKDPNAYCRWLRSSGAVEKLKRGAEPLRTHLRIVVTFLRVATGLKKLRRYQDGSVSEVKSQVHEYINFQQQTGLLRDALPA